MERPKIIDAINSVIKTSKEVYPDANMGEVSDGYHTFNELYDHRIRLFITLMKNIKNKLVWYSKKHSDGSSYEGWIIAGIEVDKGKQITYHIPESYIEELEVFALYLETAPEFDGHTSEDILDRLKNL